MTKERFIKKYLTPRGGYKVEWDLIENRFNNMVLNSIGIKNDVIKYSKTLTSDELKNTRGYFYYKKYIDKKSVLSINK